MHLLYVELQLILFFNVSLLGVLKIDTQSIL